MGLRSAYVASIIFMKMTVIGEVAQWSLVEIDRRFRDAYYLQQQGRCRSDYEGSKYL
jgi:hypothetical protein